MAFIIDDILLGPCNFVTWIGKRLYEHAESEIMDESRIQQCLLDLQMRVELGKISEDQYTTQEEALMRRLDEIRKYKESKQMQ